ncbi:MAG: DUF4159 domain-containing protein [Flavobacteriales bacterium]|jgi:hypothetical protein|nr:DUF4159 domain-containing protein [Flavobacteriales bacterium]MBT7480897.1 DUF4159 domain-containing protein [Flavobacteriales bacterium]
MKKIILILLLSPLFLFSQNTYQIAILKYNGGGDWYANPTALPNLVDFCNENINTNIKKEIAIVEVGSLDIYNYPFIHMTGHGNIVFSSEEVENLRTYLLSGGFLHIDDNYGMDPYVRSEIRKVFPNTNLVEIPPSHPIFIQKYNFKNGLPKIHEHDQNPSQAFGVFMEGKLVLLYTYESDLGDGWEDPEVHNDSKETRLEALKMGSNILEFVFNRKD